MRFFAALLLMAAAAVLVFTAFAQEDTVASRTIAPQWGRTVVRSGNVLPANQQLVRLDLAQPTDITLYLSGFDGVAGAPPSAGLYQLTWGCGATITQQLVVPVVGATWHVVATRVEVNALLNQAGGVTSLQAQAIASVGRPTLQYQHLYNGAANIGVQHVLPLFHPRFQVPRFTQALVVSAFNIVAGTPTVSELNAAGGTLLTRPASAYASGLPLDPRTWFVEFAGAAAEYDVLASAQIVE